MKNRITYLLLLCLASVLLTGCEVVDELVDEIESSVESNEKANRKQQESFDKQFENQWSQQERERANTAKNESYLSNVEKEVYYYLNLARINPPLFGKTYASAYDGTKGYMKGYAFDERKDSLLREMANMNSLPVLEPDELLFESAECFATEGGKLGIVGHDRSATGCPSMHSAECCHYGGCYTGLEIVMAFLIDAGENNAALGHRRICFSDRYHYMGVAIRDHQKSRKNVVLDFSTEKLE